MKDRAIMLHDRHLPNGYGWLLSRGRLAARISRRPPIGRRARTAAGALSFEELLEKLRSGSDIIYLYCHGGLDRDAWPYVRVGPEDEPVLTADVLFSERIRWKSPRPLIFINGCRTVAVEPEKVVEFVGALVGSAQAAGVIGAEITIFEPMATVFGVEYFKRFLNGSPVGEAIRAARLVLLAQRNPLGLVYVPFALAALRLSQAPKPAA
jgi:hypothetical protein